MRVPLLRDFYLQPNTNKGINPRFYLVFFTSQIFFAGCFNE